MKKIRTIFNILDKKYLTYLFLILVSIIFISIIEVIGIGSIPLLFSSILNTLNPTEGNISNTIISKIFFLNTLDNFELIFVLSLIIFFTFILKNLMLGSLFYAQGKMLKKLRIYFSKRVYNYYVENNPSIILTENSSKLVRTITHDIGNFTLHLIFILNLIRDFLILFFLSILLLVSNFKISSFIFISLSVVSFIIFFINKNKLFLRGKEIQKTSAIIIQKINETIGLLKEIKIYKLETYHAKKFLDNVEKIETYNFKNYFIQMLPRLILEVTVIFILVAIIVLNLRDDTSIFELLPYLSLLIITSIRLIPAVNGITTSFNTLKITKASFQLISNLLLNEANFKKTNLRIKKVKFDKKLILENIYFKYPNQKKYLFEDLNFQISKGERIGIIGTSGSGKTSLVNILIGLLNPQNGKVIIDNIVHDKYILENVGYIPQEVFLIDDTIKNNILCGEIENFDQNLFDKCIKLAELDEIVKTAPNKVDTMIGERGLNISVGQKQRIGIARALYKKPSILIFDESTSALDYRTEENFLNNIFSIDRSITLIFISHKKGPLLKCDKIFDLNKNKLELNDK